MKKIGIYKNSGDFSECCTDWFKCPNPNCGCTDIQSHHRFCPMCGLAINWIEGGDHKDTESVEIRKVDCFFVEDTGDKEWYICPNCGYECVEYPDEKCTKCGITIEWSE